MESNRRKTQFHDPNTQMVIENLSPYIMNRALHQRNLVSPQPIYENQLRAFSPCEVSEFDGVNQHSAVVNYNTTRNAISPAPPNRKMINVPNKPMHLMSPNSASKRGANALNFEGMNNTMK